jgi:GR25 family glycosyltransferase involved in LPS biosynthesis/phosphorylcholine metabolism protein LicD
MTIKILLIVVLLVIAGVLFYNRERIIGEKNHQPFSSVWTDQHKSIATKMLQDTVQILAAHGIQIIAAYGTLLGLVRHEQIIPWDDDMDVCTDIIHIPTILSLRKEFEQYDIGITTVTIAGNSFIKLYTLKEPFIAGRKWSWPFIDIFSYTVKDGMVTIDNVGKEKKYKIAYDDMFPLQTTMFENVEINIPANPKALLDNMYPGDWAGTCISSGWNHRKERHYSGTYKVSCDQVTSGYDRIPSAWIINLAKRPDRLSVTQDRLKSVGIIAQRWNATDAVDPGVVDFYEQLPLPKRSIGEVACYLSHKKLWEHIYDQNIPYAVIFEDDAYPTKDITSKDIMDIIRRSAGFDMIYLGHCFSSPSVFTQPIVTPGTAQCLHAYVISRKAIGKILAKPDDYSLPIDKITERHCMENLCFLAHHVPAQNDTFGQGIIHQDIDLGSNLVHKHLKV